MIRGLLFVGYLLVRFLAEHGADLNVKNSAGRTPLALAKSAAAARTQRLIVLGRDPSGDTATVLHELGAQDEPPEDADEADWR
jgi:ankyrin repeat protein